MSEPDAPRVSVVIPTYNSARHLVATIASVEHQTFESWELIVQDDGSSDDTVSIASTCARSDPAGRITVEVGPNAGVAAARNRGLAASDVRSEFVIFLDHDDVWLPHALGALVEALDRHGECIAAHGVARCIDGEGNEVPGDDLEDTMLARWGYRGGSSRPVPLGLAEPTTFADLAVQNWLLTPGLLLVRRTALKSVDGFDPGVVPADDWDFGVRLSRLGGIAFVPRCLLLWRRHEGAQSNISERWRRSYFEVRTRMLVDETNSPDQVRAARAGFRSVYRGSAGELLELIRRRSFRDAMRPGRRATYALLRYVRAEIQRGRRAVGARAPLLSR